MTKELNEKEKRQNGCIAGAIMIVIVIICWFVYIPNTPPYTVRLSKIGTNNNANIEIIIPNDIKDSQMKDIAKKEAQRYNTQRYVFVFFYTKDKYDCFATSHSKENYEVKRLIQGR